MGEKRMYAGIRKKRRERDMSASVELGGDEAIRQQGNKATITRDSQSRDFPHVCQCFCS
jgi:hypothetical protein